MNDTNNTPEAQAALKLARWRSIISEEQEKQAIEIIKGPTEWTLGEIGEKVGVSAQTLIRVMDRNDLWAKDEVAA